MIPPLYLNQTYSFKSNRVDFFRLFLIVCTHSASRQLLFFGSHNQEMAASVSLLTTAVLVDGLLTTQTINITFTPSGSMVGGGTPSSELTSTPPVVTSVTSPSSSSALNATIEATGADSTDTNLETVTRPSTATSSSPLQTTTKDPSSGGLSSGPVAGVAVGCAVGGLILGFVVAFLLLWSRKKRLHHQTPSPVSKVTFTLEPKNNGLVPAYDISPDKKPQLDQFLLDGAPDSDLSLELRSLDGLIHQHVENYYHLRPIPTNNSVLSQNLQSLGLSEQPGLSVGALAALCVDPNTRYAGLRHVISQVIFRSVDFSSRSALSMLPPPIATFLNSIPTSEPHESNAIGKCREPSDIRHSNLCVQQCNWRFRDGAVSQPFSSTLILWSGLLFGYPRM